jgi:tRNA modification GTPase
MPQELHPASKIRHIDPSGYFSQKTIVALCTPMGGALAMVRISGTESIRIFSTLSKLNESNLVDRKALRCKLYGKNLKLIDDAVAVVYLGNRSFTGEPVVELCLHGSPIIAQKMIDEVIQLGARMALPGEFSFRAVKNGKLSLSQAEAVKDLIAADNDFALDLALEKLSGTQHQFVQQLRDQLLQLVTLAEVGIDFSDQDIDELSLPNLKIKIQSLLAVLNRLHSSFDRGKRISQGVSVSIFGLPNAGKSSFFNALIGEDRSIVSDQAGTTRDVVRERIHLQGRQGYVAFRIADTAGLRNSHDLIEGIGIDRSISSAESADILLVVVDGSHSDEGSTEQIILKQLENVETFFKKLKKIPSHILCLLTKVDLLKAKQIPIVQNQVNDFFSKLLGRSIPSVAVSSTQLIGVNQVAQILTDFAESELFRAPNEVVLSQVEHVQAVAQAIESLSRALSSADVVLFATDVRHAMNELGPLLGETIPDDVLGKIFSDFCIGK